MTDAAKKAYEDATAALDAYVREQSRRYTTADLHLTSLDFRCPLDSYGRITTQFAEPDPWGIPTAAPILPRRAARPSMRLRTVSSAPRGR